MEFTPGDLDDSARRGVSPTGRFHIPTQPTLTKFRSSAQARGYDASWRKVRLAFLSAHPFCSHPGCGRPAVDVDHVERVRDNPKRRLDPTNLVGYCHSHHSAKTAAADGGFGNPASGKRRPVLGVDRTGRPLDPNHPWHRAPQGGI